MVIEFYCPGHFRQFTTAGGKSSYGKFFCSGCKKRFLKTFQQRMEQTAMKLTDPKTWIRTKKRDDLHLSIERFSHSKLGRCNDISACLTHYYNTANADFSGRLLVGLCLTAFVVFNVDSLQAIPTVSLRAPLQAVKNEMWSYLFAVKASAVLGGAGYALVKQSVQPFIIGAAIFGGVTFFDGLLGDGAAALIG